MAKLSSTQVFGNLDVLGDVKVAGELLIDGTISGIDKSDVGLGNVDNTSDLNKPVSTATQTALDGKSDSVHNHDEVYLSYTKTQSITNNQRQHVWDTIGVGASDVDFVAAYINTRGQV